MKTLPMNTAGQIAWHYTNGIKARLIVESEELRPSTAFIEKREKPVLWLTTNQRWDAGAQKMLIDESGNPRLLSMEETAEYCDGLWRFGMPASQTIGYPRIAKLARIRHEVRKSLEAVARKQGSNPREWCGLLKPVSIWGLYVQRMEAGEWVTPGPQDQQESEVRE